jgi:hypothetical protein
MVYQDQTLAMGGRCDGRTGDLYTASVRVTIDSDQSNEMGAGQDLVGTTCLRADEVPMQEKTLYEWHCALGHTNARNIKLLGKDPAVSGVKNLPKTIHACWLTSRAKKDDTACWLTSRRKKTIQPVG